MIMSTTVIFVLSTPTKSSQISGSAVDKQRREVHSPLLPLPGDDHKRLGVARALFAFTTKNPRYVYMYMIRMFRILEILENANALYR